MFILCHNVLISTLRAELIGYSVVISILSAGMRLSKSIIIIVIIIIFVQLYNVLLMKILLMSSQY